MSGDLQRTRIGELLLQLGFITPEDLAAGLALQRQGGRRLGEVLIGLGLISEAKLAKALHRQTGAEEWDPRAPVHERVVRMFPAELGRAHHVFPVAIRRSGILTTWCLATADPTDEATRQKLGEALCTEDQPVQVVWFVATASSIEQALLAHYPLEDRAEPEQLEEREEPSRSLDLLIEDPVEAHSAEEAARALARIKIAKRPPGQEE
jgi:type IV pilus assembly protein PilB